MPISSYSDDELLSAIRHDDEKAFAELFERYWKQVHAMTYAMVRFNGSNTRDCSKYLYLTLGQPRNAFNKPFALVPASSNKKLRVELYRFTTP